MLESSIQITELVNDLDAKQNCDNCELHRKVIYNFKPNVLVSKDVIWKTSLKLQFQAFGISQNYMISLNRVLV